MLRQYFNYNERLEMFLTCFCDILCYVGMCPRGNMTHLFEVLTSLHVRAVIRFLTVHNFSPVKIHKQLTISYTSEKC